MTPEERAVFYVCKLCRDEVQVFESDDAERFSEVKDQLLRQAFLRDIRNWDTTFLVRLVMNGKR